MHLVEQPNGTFTTQELERLAAYRAAVAAGFYSDWDGSDQATDTTVLAWLPRALTAAGDEVYPFTLEERERLEQLKATVAEGVRYADDRPPAATTAPSNEAEA